MEFRNKKPGESWEEYASSGRSHNAFGMPSDRFQTDSQARQGYVVKVDCPGCGGQMVVRTNSQTEVEFWGCSAFPDCRGNMDYWRVPEAANHR